MILLPRGDGPCVLMKWYLGASLHSGLAKTADPHRDLHAECPKSVGEDIRGILSDALCFFT